MVIFIILTAASAGLAVCTALQPVYLTKATDACAVMDGEGALKYFLIFVLCIAGILAFEAVRQILESYYTAQKTEKLKKSVLGRIMNMDIETFSEENAQNYMTLLNQEIDMLVNNFYLRRTEFVYSLLVLVTSLTALIYINPILAGIIIVMTFVPIGVSGLCGEKIAVRTNMYTESLRRFNVMIGNLIQGYSTVKVNKISENYSEVLDKFNKETARMKFKEGKTKSIINMIVGLLSYTRNILLVGVSFYMILNGKLTIGALLGALQISEMLAIPTHSTASQLNDMNSVKMIKEKVLAMVSQMKREHEGKESCGEIQRIEFKHVSFSYGEKKILNDINLSFDAGKKYLILGENGSGKSTLFKLMSRFETCYDGEIFVNGKNLRQLGEDFYDYIGIVLQTPFVFNDTLYNNVSLYGKKEDGEIMAVLNKLELSNFLKHHKLSDVYKDTEDNLSGGEKQKLALARVMLKQKKFILLDEATAAVDAASSYTIEKTLLDSRELTVVNIEHKLIKELLPYYDVIYKLSDGRIYEIDKAALY